MRILQNLLKESFLFALHSLVNNKVRTFLSLFGITIGIFAIIGVYSALDSLETSVMNSVAKLGDNVIYVQKWPWQFGGEYEWWKYVKRPLPTTQEADELAHRSQKTDVVVFTATTRKTIQYENNSVSNATILTGSHEVEKAWNFEIFRGRYFTLFESTGGRNVAVIGYDLAQQLFENADPLNKTIKVGGKKVTIVGVFKKEGNDPFGQSTDKLVLLPLNFGRSVMNIKSENVNPFIIMKGKKGVSVTELMDETRGLMRSVRRLRPLEDDNFALNQSSLLTSGLDSIFSIIKLGGFVISLFSILVGGFGIANIMFVSVKEQTQIIGIQKALGAKRLFILMQFLFEAVFLSLFGGALGLLLTYIGILIANSVSSMEFLMTSKNIIMGFSISGIIGVVSGFMPARSAARLDPVVAINKL